MFNYYFNGSIFLFFYLDDIGQLNAEEKAFIEDPANAHLFDDPPSAEKKGAREHQSPVPGMAKKSKPSYDKVSGRVDFNIQCRLVRKHINSNLGFKCDQRFNFSCIKVFLLLMSCGV